ncbi:hypothetical protein pb186bvf_008620 [Paramecium bursaria]
MFYCSAKSYLEIDSKLLFQIMFLKRTEANLPHNQRNIIITRKVFDENTQIRPLLIIVNKPLKVEANVKKKLDYCFQIQRGYLNKKQLKFINQSSVKTQSQYIHLFVYDLEKNYLYFNMYIEILIILLSIFSLLANYCKSLQQKYKMFCCSVSKEKKKIPPPVQSPKQQIPVRQNDSIQQSTQVTYQVDSNEQQISNSEMQKIVEQLKELSKMGKHELRIQKEERLIGDLINDQSMKEEYYLEQKWAIQYTQFLKSKGQKLRAIDNNTLLKVPANGKVIISGPQMLKPNIKKEHDYCLLNQKSWQFVQLMYGGGPEMVLGILDESTQGKTRRVSDAIQKSTYTSEIKEQKEIRVTPQKQQPQSQIVQQPVEIQQKTNFELPLVGLRNPDIYCYINAALQCLLSFPQLNETLSRVQTRTKFLSAYKNLLLQVSQSSQRQINVIVPRDIWACAMNKFNQSQQQDSHEFLLFFLSQMQEEFVGKYRSTKEFKNAKDAWDHYTKTNNDIIVETFAGQLTSKSLCKACKKVSEGYDPIWDLSLPLAKSWLNSEFDLIECLRAYFKEEIIDDKWKCDLCNVYNTSVKRQLQITQTPKILIIQLKRFSNYPRREKILSNAKYPANLDIKEQRISFKFLLQSFCTSDQTSTRYKLKAIISHQGQINGGHYYTTAERGGIWYTFNDSKVERMQSGSSTSEKQAYILFYEKI